MKPSPFFRFLFFFFYCECSENIVSVSFGVTVLICAKALTILFTTPFVSSMQMSKQSNKKQITS